MKSEWKKLGDLFWKEPSVCGNQTNVKMDFLWVTPESRCSCSHSVGLQTTSSVLWVPPGFVSLSEDSSDNVPSTDRTARKEGSWRKTKKTLPLNLYRNRDKTLSFPFPPSLSSPLFSPQSFPIPFFSSHIGVLEIVNWPGKVLIPTSCSVLATFLILHHHSDRWFELMINPCI